MVSLKYANAMAEVLQYLKGIRKEDVDKIPEKFMKFLKENASINYECNFDYNKPLKELELLDETRGIIGMICYNYWCETEAQKHKFLEVLNENEKKYQDELSQKYNTDNLFKNKKKYEEMKEQTNLPIEIKKQTLFEKIFEYIRKVLRV